MLWIPEPIWSGRDVWIIGGGPSLAGFDWRRLEGLPTIGCNSAFTLGGRVCSLCFFSDYKWFDVYQEEILKADMMFATHCPNVPDNHPKVYKLRRHAQRLTPREDGFVFYGYGGSSGSGAIHLALMMGAQRVLLLGFDGKLSPQGQPNWHNRLVDPIRAEVYKKFEEAYGIIARTYQTVFPGTEILNCNPDSTIPFFPKTTWMEALSCHEPLPV